MIPQKTRTLVHSRTTHHTRTNRLFLRQGVLALRGVPRRGWQSCSVPRQCCPSVPLVDPLGRVGWCGRWRWQCAAECKLKLRASCCKPKGRSVALVGKPSRSPGLELSVVGIVQHGVARPQTRHRGRHETCMRVGCKAINARLAILIIMHTWDASSSMAGAARAFTAVHSDIDRALDRRTF
jgi:hypothetical protein